MTADSSTSPINQADPNSFERLASRAAELEQQFADAQAKYLRSLADFQNFQRRALLNEQEARLQGRGQVVQSLLGVLDNFDLALNVDTMTATAEQVVKGVRVIREELLRILQSHGVNLLSPEQGDEFDPMVHQAVVQQEDDSVPPGRIVATLQPGYTLCTSLPGEPRQERVIRPAMVAVRPA
ncbi:MAG: nucleotide exchange factor GrpE [Phycisphaeraceae bacterium]|nr:nucleotide exchange factor GrpE [Phycisphaerae bacterium]MBX3391203.1 nucleotide exchange factor GrpE [Phycisphaeraceae bacterium]HRJ49411.1 nucleotide exchange factor GrpE [Phycisphaerales bacterium]